MPRSVASKLASKRAPHHRAPTPQFARARRPTFRTTSPGYWIFTSWSAFLVLECRPSIVKPRAGETDLRTGRGVSGVGRTVGALLAAALICLAFAASALAAAPANDDFADAQAISLDTSVSGSNFEATKQTGEPDHAGNAGGHSVWYSWTAPRTEPIGITLPCQFANQSELLVGVYTGSAVDALTPVASSQGLNAACTPGIEPQQVEFEAQAGVEYKIAADGKNGATGFFSFALHAA